MTVTEDHFSVCVDSKLCIGCNLCCEVAREVFFMVGDKCRVKKDVNLSNQVIREKAILASQACPTGAIKIDLNK